MESFPADRRQALAPQTHSFYAAAFVENLSLKELAGVYPEARRTARYLRFRTQEGGEVFIYPFGAAVFFAAVVFFAAAVFFRRAFFFAVGALPAARLACSLPCSFAFAALRGTRRFTALLTVFGITPRVHDDVANGFRHQKARIAARAHRAPQSAR